MEVEKLCNKLCKPKQLPAKDFVLFTNIFVPCVGMQDNLGIRAVDSKFQVLDSFVSEIWILDSNR